MDGIAITSKPEEAFACFGMDGVRHVAELSTGEGLVAFDGPIPCEGATIYANVPEQEFMFWPKVKRVVAKVKRRSPFGGDGVAPQEHYGLYAPDVFLQLPSAYISMASLIVGGLILAVTTREEPGAIWSATTVSFQDIRVNDGALVLVSV